MSDIKAKTSEGKIFEKAHEFTTADEIKEMGLYPYFKPLQATNGTNVCISLFVFSR